jgi:hypothetical protein
MTDVYICGQSYAYLYCGGPLLDWLFGMEAASSERNARKHIKT